MLMLIMRVICSPDALKLDLLFFLMKHQFIGVQRNRRPVKQAHLAVNLLQ
jgi:hypothetical protein